MESRAMLLNTNRYLVSSWDHLQVSMSGMFNSNVCKEFYNVPDNSDDKQPQKGGQTSPPQVPLPVVCLEVPEDDDPKKETYHRTANMSSITHLECEK